MSKWNGTVNSTKDELESKASAASEFTGADINSKDVASYEKKKSMSRQKDINDAQRKRQKANTVARAGQLAAERMKKKKKKLKAFQDRGMNEKDATYSPSGRDN